MKARKHELNLDPGFNPLDPKAVSDPKSWIDGESIDVLKRVIGERISVIRHAPKMPKSDSDISDQVEVDKVSGKYRLKK